MVQRTYIYRIACLALLILTAACANAKIYYSKGAPGNWTASTSWSTTGYGGATNTGTYPSTNDTALIGNGYTININSSITVTSITVGQGISGSLFFANSATYTLTVSGDITVNSGGSFSYNNNSSRTHSLNLSGNFTNNGNVDFVYDSNDKVNLTFTGTKNSVVSGGGTWALNTVTMNKTTLSTYTLDVTSNAFETAIASLVVTQGTYIHNNSGSYSINSAAASNFTIGSNVIFKVPLGTVTFSPNTATLNLQGSLYVSGGNVYVGTTTGTGGILYKQNGGSPVPYLEVTAGTLTVYGAVTYNAAGEPISFMMSGGTILVHSGSTGTNQDIFFVNDKTTSSFVMSGGTIIIQNHNLSGGPNVDFAVCGSNGTVNVTGGTVQFGNSSTPNGTTFDFLPFANIVQPSFKLSGAAASGNKVMTTQSTTTDFQLLSLYISSGTTFDIQSISGTAGNSKKMTLTGTYDGISAFYNDGTFNGQIGTVELGGTMEQRISGSTTTSFYDFTVNASDSVVLNKPIIVTDYLNMLSGKIKTTSTNIISLTSSANASLGTAASYVDGPLSQDVAQSTPRTVNLPIGKGAYWRPLVFTVTHSSSSSATYTAEVYNSSAAAMPYILPGTLTKVSSVRYWNLARSGAGNFQNATLKIYYGSDDGVTDKTNLRVAQAVNPNWVNLGGSGSANGTGNITSGSFTTFTNVFTLGNLTGGGNPLPVELVSFTSDKKEQSIELNWTTASELNNDYFSVERSENGMEFAEIARIKGAGNSTAMLNYFTIDNHPLNGNNYYRLRQTDFNGVSTISKPIQVRFEKKQALFLSPNPYHKDFLDVHMSVNANTLVKVRICDTKGTLVFQKELMVENECDHFRLDDLQILNDGIYIVNVDDGNMWYREKLIVQRKQAD